MTGSRLNVQRAKSQEDLGERLGARNPPPASIPKDGELARRNIQDARESNSLVPINRLPTELLIAVFHDSLETCSNRFEGLRAIASVAWLWCGIVKGAPALWAVLESSTRMDHLLIQLQRAGDLPLKITMHPDPPHRSLSFEGGGSEPQSAAFLDLVLPKLACWKEANLFLQSKRWDLSETLGKLEQPAPLLRRFCVDTKLLHWASQVDLFQGHAPNLAELSIYKLPIRWNSNIFCDLVSISIWGVTKSGPTVEDVLQWIVSCPRLRFFRLSSSALSPSIPHQDVLTVELPHLRSLDLTFLPPFPTQLILSRIRAPAMRELIVRQIRPATTDSNHLPTFFNDSLLHFTPAICSSINNAQGLAISMHVLKGHIFVSTIQEPDGNEGIKIDFHHQPGISGLQLCLEFLLRGVSLCPPISLAIMGPNDVPESDLLWILDSVINDKVTEISTENFGDDSFLAFLCRERCLAGVAKWPFPKLKTLLITQRVLILGEILLRLIRQRYAPDLGEGSTTATSDSRSPLILEAPDRLVSLTIKDAAFSRSDYDNLVNIVGAGVLHARLDY